MVQGIPIIRSKTYLHLFSIFFSPASLYIIAGGFRFFLLEIPDKEFSTLGINDKHGFPFHPCPLLFRRWLLLFLNLYTILFSQKINSFRVTHSFMLHDKTNDVTTFMAAEAMPNSPHRVNLERRGFLLVYRATSLVVGTAPF